MISAWWLFLIVPASACLGCAACVLMMFAKAVDAEEEI